MNFHLMAQRKVWLTFLNKTSSIILPCQIVTYVLNSFLDNGFFMCWKDEISQTIISAFCQNNFARLFLNYCKRFFDCPLMLHKYAIRVGSILTHQYTFFYTHFAKNLVKLNAWTPKEIIKTGTLLITNITWLAKNHF